MTAVFSKWLRAAFGAALVAVCAIPSAHADPAPEATTAPWAGTFTVVGHIVGIDTMPEPGILVVDVPTSKGVLRVGATVPEGTTFTVGARKISLQDLRLGQRLRLVVKRVPGGDEVVTGELLPDSSRKPNS